MAEVAEMAMMVPKAVSKVVSKMVPKTVMGT